jgi:chromosome partitioning protein
MRHILVMNPKGGCGKSTIATNIAAYFANAGKKVALADYDPQGSSLDWIKRRPADRPAIDGLCAHEEGLRHLARNSDIVVSDAPARSHGTELTNLVRHAETIVIPVMASPIDMQAVSRFVDEIKHVGKVERHQVKMALVANRVKENTKIFDELDEFLENQRVPYVAVLREAQNYIRAYARGLGIFELPEYLAWPDLETWDPLIEWLESRRSRPRT